MFKKQKENVMETIDEIINVSYEKKNYDLIRILTMTRNHEGIIGKLIFSFLMICSVIGWHYIDIKHWLGDIKYYTKHWLRRLKR